MNVRCSQSFTNVRNRSQSFTNVRKNLFILFSIILLKSSKIKLFNAASSALIISLVSKLVYVCDNIKNRIKILKKINLKPHRSPTSNSNISKTDQPRNIMMIVHNQA